MKVELESVGGREGGAVVGTSWGRPVGMGSKRMAISLRHRAKN